MTARPLSLDPGTLGFHIPFREFAGYAAAAGFDMVEVPCKAAREFDTPEALRAFLEERKLRAPLHSCPWDLPANGAVPDAEFAKRVDAIADIAAFSRACGAEALSVFFRCSSQGMQRLSLDELAARVTALTSAAGMAITVELNDPEYLRKAATVLSAAPRARLLVDLFHVVRSGLDAGWIASLPPGSIGWVHLSDAGNDLLVKRPADVPREMPGDGVLPLRELIAAIDATGYAGPLSIEVLNEKLLRGDPRQVALDAFTKSRRFIS